MRPARRVAPRERDGPPPPGLTELYPLASLLIAALLSVWLVSRTLLFLKMHDTVHSQHFSDLGSLRTHTSRPVAEAPVQQPPAGYQAGSLKQAVVRVNGASPMGHSPAAQRQDSSCHLKKNIEYGGDLGASQPKRA